MAEDYGSGVSRTLSALWRQFGAVVFQEGNPPLDSEVNLGQQIAWDQLATAIRSVMPSGFLMDPTRPLDDFRFNQDWSNYFILGNPRGDSPHDVHDADEKNPVIWANVNGWIIPVAGTDIETADGLHNIIKLYPPPSSDTRVDYVFLEAWQTLVAPNPSTANKPSASTVWKYGNVKFGGTNITDDIEDPDVGNETTERVQIQYRIRVFGEGLALGSSVSLDVYPDGLGDPNILGQGAASAPVAGYIFENMRQELGDPSLWRTGAGDATSRADLGSVDGYTYAIPICALFRRNTGTYVPIVDGGGSANQNGAFDRTPTTKLLPDPLTGARTLLEATLVNDLAWDTVGVFSVNDLNGSGWEDDQHVLANTYMLIDGEVIGIDAVDTGTGEISIAVDGRGRHGTHAEAHAAGAVIQFFNYRTDGLYADEISPNDMLDLRRAVNPGDWDYQRLLEHNIAALARNEMRTAWKRSGPGDTEGPVIHEVDYLDASGGIVPNQTEPLDGPDGIRQIWSDAAVIQPDVTLLLDNEFTGDTGIGTGGIGFAGANSFQATSTWGVAPDFLPIGFVNHGGSIPAGTWTNGSSIIFHIGGEDGTEGARGTFRDGSTRAVRFLGPKEFWKANYPVIEPSIGNQHPVTIRFLNQWSQETLPADLGAVDPTTPEKFPGPMYPWQEQNFERPFLVLGGLLENTLRNAIVAGDLVNTTDTQGDPQYEIDLGLSFDAFGIFYTQDATGAFANDPSLVSIPFLRGERTLFGMLTNNGRDRTGASSEVYILLYGDQDSTDNNGAFKVVGAGSVGYTHRTASNATSVVVEPLSADFDVLPGGTGFDTTTGNSITYEFRSPWTNSEDGGARTGFTGDLAIVLTDIGGQTTHPWNLTTLGVGHPFDMHVPFYPTDPPADPVADKAAIPSKLLVGLTLLYHPGHSGMARVPDDVVRTALRNNTNTYLRQSPDTIDPDFTGTATPNPVETYYDPVHVQTWNRLPGLGWSAPTAPNYGGNVVGFTEQDREHELFFDKGSKTLIFRPFRDRAMTLQAITYPELGPDQGLMGNYNYDPTGVPYPKDKLQLWTAGNTGTYAAKVGRVSGTQGVTFTGSGQQMGFIVPREYMPRFGRQDIPYYNDQAAGTGPFLSGINHLFRDAADLTSPVFQIIGGDDNTTGSSQVTVMHLRTTNPADYGKGVDGTNIVPGVPGNFYESRVAPRDINSAVTFAPAIIDAFNNVTSSDLGKGLSGIQLPPFLGPARVIGVYDARDFEVKGGRTVQADRFTPETDPAPNLLKTDADQQTLFLMQDGAKDMTQEPDDHTYIIPSEALDISRALNYVQGDVFEDYNYVVVVTVFGFAKGFVNKSNYVLVRAHGGTGLGVGGGSSNLDGEDPQIEGVHLCIPSAAGLNEHVYVAHNRTVYQGDPYMTRGGDIRTVTDYENRYGQLTMAERFAVATPLEQDTITIPNPRAFEVLASLDFYTTLGTGKIGGTLPPGTLLDVGFLDATEDSSDRIPQSASAQPWRVLPRAFTEGQVQKNTTRGRLVVDLLDNQKLSSGTGVSSIFASLYFFLPDGSESILSFTTPYNQGDWIAFVTGSLDPAIEVSQADVDQTTRASHQFSSEVLDFSDTGTFATAAMLPGETRVLVLTSTTTIPWSTTAPVLIETPSDYSNAYGAVVFDAWVSSSTPVPSQITVRAVYTMSDSAFRNIDLGSGLISPSTITFDTTATALGSLAPGASTTQTSIPWPGGSPLTANDHLVASVAPEGAGSSTVSGEAGFLSVVASYDGSGGFDLTFTNLGPTTFNTTGTVRVRLAALRSPSADLSITVGPAAFTAMQATQVGTAAAGDLAVTAWNAARAINLMPKLGQVVSARSLGSQVILESRAVGAESNQLHVRMGYLDSPNLGIEEALRFLVPSTNAFPPEAVTTDTDLAGGVDLPLNAGNGTSQLRLTGMTERLPLGILVQDHDFLCENPLGDTASAMKTTPAGIRPVQTLMPLTGRGEEHRRFLGAPGDLLAMADGSIGVYGATGVTSFRLYRGGGSAFVLSGQNPGGPVDWVADTFPASSQPVMKGGALVCRALLVRNYYEEAFVPGTAKVSDGSEIQMVLITHGVFGDGNTQQEGVELSGLISPTGYGEGYAAADRYRIDGRPMFGGHNRSVPDPEDVTLAPYPETPRGN
jgi:hypothetical protein